MSFMERLSLLLANNKVSRNKFCADVGVGKNAVVDWEKRGNTPGGETLSEIASYFQVTTDYLLGLTDDPTPPGHEKASALDVAEAMADKFMDMHGRRPTAEEQSKLKTLMDAVIKGAKDD